MNAKEYLKTLDADNQVWDNKGGYEYTEKQLLQFAEDYHEKRVLHSTQNHELFHKILPRLIKAFFICGLLAIIILYIINVYFCDMCFFQKTN